MKRGYAIGLLMLLSYSGSGQIFKNIGVSSGINFAPLEWEYRYSGTEPTTIRKSETQPVGVNVYITTYLIEKKLWTINSSLGWIQKRGMFTEKSGVGASVPYKLDYISWINSMKGRIPLGKQFSVNVALGPRIEYCLTPWDDIPEFAPNDDTFFYFHRKEDVRRFIVGLTGEVGLSWQIKRTTLQLIGWKNFNFNPIISAHGPRADGLGDKDFYFEMRGKTYGMNLQFTFPF